MRRAERAISDSAQIKAILENEHVGRLATNGSDGCPRIKPLNYVYKDGYIYFHSALDGEKIQDIAKDSRVCFEVDTPLGYVKAKGSPCSASYRYRSIIIQGRAHIIESIEEKYAVLGALMHKYQPEAGWDDANEVNITATLIVRIEIDRMTGKENIGKQ